ncbi:hypothetical protein [Caenispirillum salinarum]|uniref:hypothetical protein n=1 Tax=Caenispirillum salinarum TaxID=859058 RepID=UPI00126760CD|nr:hypothetical protein [Caenispirillum salinarum]
MAFRRFTLFHLSLSPVPQADLETYKIGREEWLRKCLGQTLAFPHHGARTLHWLPLKDDDDLILGLLQLQKPHDHHRPPEEGGAEVTTDEWQGAYVLVDPTTHEQGQRVAVENDVVGKPSALIRSLVRHINQNSYRPYNIEVDHIFDSQDFWKFAKESGGKLRSIRFDFAVPNMWDTTGDIDRDLRDTREENGAERVQYGMESSVGVATDTNKIREAVRYSERGAGKITARSLDNKRFSSSRRPAVTEIPRIAAPREVIADALRGLKNWILGHGENTAVDRSDRTGDDSGGD